MWNGISWRHLTTGYALICDIASRSLPPSYAFEISSRSGDTEPKLIEVPQTVWR